MLNSGPSSPVYFTPEGGDITTFNDPQKRKMLGGMVGKGHLLPASTDKRMWDVRMRVGYQVVVPNPPPQVKPLSSTQRWSLSSVWNWG